MAESILPVSDSELKNLFTDHEDESPYVSIQYSDYRTENVPRIDMLEDMLVKERREVFLVGEGNFTFSVALAALRDGSWEGITVTRYWPISDSHPKPDFYLVKLTAIEQLCLIARKQPEYVDMMMKNIHDIVKLPQPNDCSWMFGIDATKLPDALCAKGNLKVVWFQCPWVPDCSERNSLICRFLEHMSRNQSQGDYTLIGIATYYPWVKEYKLDELLGEDLSGKDGTMLSALNYKFLGADKTLIKKILKFGYRHLACEQGVDIHFTLFDTHCTLVFQKK